MPQLNVRLTLLIAAANPLVRTSLRPELEVGIMPSSLEADSRVKQRQAARRNNDHSSLKHHEKRFITGEKLRVESTSKLHTSVD